MIFPRSRMTRVAIAVAAIVALQVMPASAARAQGEVLYIVHLLSNDITIFEVGPEGGLTPKGDRVSTRGGQARGLVFTPDGRRAYTSNGATGTIAAFAVDEQGSLTPHGAPVETGGEGPFGVAIAPDGSALYTANIDSGTVSTLAIDADGTPRPVGSPVKTGFPDPRGLAVAPDGRFIFVSHGRPEDGRRDNVIAFAVRPGGGLTPVGRPMPVGSGGSQVVVTPDGRFLYVASTGSDAAFGFGIARDGTLNPVPGSPFPAADFPENAAVTPDGRRLYVTSPNPDTAITRNVSAFTITDNGALRRVPGSPFPAGTRTVGVTTTPDGRRLYAGNFSSHDVSAFTIGRAGGLETINGSPFPTGGMGPSHQGAAIAPNQGPVASFTARPGRPARFDASASTDPDGRVSRYDWDFGDGTVRPDAGPRPAHRYQRPGTYRVTLTTTDEEGCSTRPIFTGQSLLCNGTPAARTSRIITVG